MWHSPSSEAEASETVNSSQSRWHLWYSDLKSQVQDDSEDEMQVLIACTGKHMKKNLSGICHLAKEVREGFSCMLDICFRIFLSEL